MRSLLLACTLLAPLTAHAKDTYVAFQFENAVTPEVVEMPFHGAGYPYDDGHVWAMAALPPKSGSFTATVKIAGIPVCHMTVSAKTVRDKVQKCDVPAEIGCHQKVEIEVAAVKGKPKGAGIAMIFGTERSPCPKQEDS